MRTRRAGLGGRAGGSGGRRFPGAGRARRPAAGCRAFGAGGRRILRCTAAAVPHAGAGPFVPARRFDRPVLLVQGEGDEESAEGEGPFGVGQGPVVVPEPVGVAVAGQVAQVAGRVAVVRGSSAGTAPRRAGSSRAASSAGVLRGALPPSVGMQRGGCGVGGDVVGQGEPVAGGGAGVREPRRWPAARRRRSAGCGSRAGCRFPRSRRRVRSTGR